MPKDGRPRRRVGAKRRSHRMREDPSTYGTLSGEEGMSPQQLVAHRELAVIRNPSPERWRKLAEARAALARAGGDDRPAA